MIYTERKALEVSGSRIGMQELPGSISLAVTSAAEVSPGPDVAAIRFYPFGGSTGGDFEIGGPGGGGTLVQVGWLMGEVTQTAMR